MLSWKEEALFISESLCMLKIIDSTFFKQQFKKIWWLGLPSADW